jgi:hypothetical protein
LWSNKPTPIIANMKIKIIGTTLKEKKIFLFFSISSFANKWSSVVRWCGGQKKIQGIELEKRSLFTLKGKRK